MLAVTKMTSVQATSFFVKEKAIGIVPKKLHFESSNQKFVKLLFGSNAMQT